MTTKPKTHDDYLARVNADKRAALQKLRRIIKAAAPKAEECISYQIPAFRLKGKFLVAYGAAANHCAFYPGSVLTQLENELEELQAALERIDAGTYGVDEVTGKQIAPERLEAVPTARTNVDTEARREPER